MKTYLKPTNKQYYIYYFIDMIIIYIGPNNNIYNRGTPSQNKPKPKSPAQAAGQQSRMRGKTRERKKKKKKKKKRRIGDSDSEQRQGERRGRESESLRDLPVRRTEGGGALSSSTRNPKVSTHLYP